MQAVLLLSLLLLAGCNNATTDEESARDDAKKTVPVITNASSPAPSDGVITFPKASKRQDSSDSWVLQPPQHIGRTRSSGNF